MKLLHKLLIALAVASITTACTDLKAYERVYVNDPEMQMSGNNVGQFETYVESIREGTVSPQGEKGSGGCGCN